jgi:hypothetical protein
MQSVGGGGGGGGGGVNEIKNENEENDFPTSLSAKI